MSAVTAMAGDGSRVDSAPSDARARRIAASALAATVAVSGVCLLTLVAPFEMLRPLVTLPGQSLSSVEAVVVAVVAAWSAAIVLSGTRRVRGTALAGPWLALIAAALLAAVLAPEHRENAVHMAGRLTLAFAVFLVAVSAADSPASVRAIFIASLAAGVIVGVLVVLEYAGNLTVLSFLENFRPGIALVGSQVRAAGPFQYPTIASMYLEIVFAFGLGLLPWALTIGRRGTSFALLAVLLFIGEAIVLTFTRAGLLAIAGSALVVGGLQLKRHGLDRGTRAIAMVIALVAVEALASRSVEALSLRMTTETPAEWYRAAIDPPRQLTMQTGGEAIVPVVVTNNGHVTWTSTARPPFRFSYHWLEPDSDRVVVWEGLRTRFDRPVPPGTTTTIDALVRAPSRPGTYDLVWDVELQYQLWFSSEPTAVLVATPVVVSGSGTGALDRSGVTRLPRLSARPGRFVLWGAAARIFAAHPITGIGLDNYRLEYGPYARISNADPRVHSNNMYLEVLVGTGLVGAVAALWFAVRAFRAFAAAAARRVDPALGAGLAAAGAAIAIHGVLDSFLSFTATYVLMAITLGLASAMAGNSDLPVDVTAHAHRV